MARNRIRLAACATHPIQYQAPVWRRLAQDPAIEFHAFFGTDMSVRGYRDAEFGAQVSWDTPLTEGYAHTFLSTDPDIQRVNVWAPAARGLRREFRAFQPDVVLLTAYGARFHIGAMAAARRTGAKIVMRHEASDIAVARSGIKNRVRDGILRGIYARVDRFGAIGIEARRHLLRLGVAPERIGRSPYCVDTDFFAGEMRRWGPQRGELRREWGIGPNDVALVFSGKLIPKKDPLLIPAAVRALPESVRGRIHLLVAGDGELRPAMEAACREALGRRSRFLGFLNQSEMGRIYAAGDLLMLPSRRGAGETWGLVVNEAMQFGLSVIVSDGVGCAVDLVSDETGRVFPSGDVAAAARALEERAGILGRNEKKTNDAAIARVAGYSVEAAAEGLAAIARETAGGSRS